MIEFDLTRGAAGAPAAGNTGYKYRVDLTQAVTQVDASCVFSLKFTFGQVLPYDDH
jgi:hypothetical protein